MVSTIRQSLNGLEHDFTKGPIGEAVILLAIPMILELGLESVFAVVDMFFVSRLGPNAIATVGLTEAVVTIVYSVAIGLSTGATAIVARRIGEKHFESATKAGVQSILLALVISVILSLIGTHYAPEVLAQMGASPEVISEGLGFTQIMLGGTTVIILLFLINGIFRGAGNAAMAMKSLWIASATNIILCPFLIHFYGVKGAAIATVTGRSAGVIYQCYHLFFKPGVLKFKATDFYFDFKLMGSNFSVAWPATIQFLIGSGSWIILTRLVAETGGTAASAGYQIAFRAFVFFILPAWGLSNAAATLVGQNLGASEMNRAEESVYLTVKFSAVLMFFVTLFLVGFAPSIIQIFTQDATVLGHAVQALQVIGSGFIFYGVGMVMTQALNGAGDTKTPTWINFFCFWVFQTPLAYFLALGVGYGPVGAVLSIPISHGMLALVAWYFFKRGSWKKLKI